MNRNARPLFYAVAIMTLAACATGPKIDENPVAAAMEPMANLSREAGFSIRYNDLTTGEEGGWSITEVAGDGVLTALHADGCGWTDLPEWFSPVLSWSNCGGTNGWGSGTNVIKSSKGSLWPLEVGKTSSYTFDNTSSTGEKNRKKRKCAVVSTANITVPMGTFDTYKVQCKETSKKRTVTRTWYFAPGIGEVKYMRVNSDSGVKAHHDVIEVTKS